jgi:hypothetical protein
MGDDLERPQLLQWRKNLFAADLQETKLRFRVERNYDAEQSCGWWLM